MPPPLSAFPIIFLSKFPHEIQAHNPLQRHPLPPPPPPHTHTHYNHEAKNHRYLNSPKLSFFCMNKAQGYFGAKAGGFNLYTRPIPKCDLQCQSFNDTVTQMRYMNRATN